MGKGENDRSEDRLRRVVAWDDFDVRSDRLQLDFAGGQHSDTLQ